MSDVEQWEPDEQRAMDTEITTLRGQVEKLTEECVVLRASARSKFETIATLEQQVEKLTKERDDLRSRRCEVCGYLEHEREHTGCLREQLAALAEQNEKMREALIDTAYFLEQHSNRWDGIKGKHPNDVVEAARNALSLPDLASPVLNRIRAEGMRMAADQFGKIWTQSAMVQKELHRMAAELENWTVGRMDARSPGTSTSSATYRTPALPSGSYPKTITNCWSCLNEA